MPPRSNPAKELAEKLVQTLTVQRGLRSEAYPTTLGRLRELTDPQMPDELFQKAIGQKAFKGQALVAQKANPASPVALRSDLEQLAASPALLEFALEARCTPEAPAQPLGKLKAALEPPLRAPFEAAVKRRIEEGTLPPTAGARIVGRSPQLFLKRMPPPEPVKPPEVHLAERMIEVLQSPGEAFPMRLNRLIELAAPDAPRELVESVLARKPLKDRIVLADRNNPLSPVALVEDLERLVVSPLLLEFVLESVCTPERPAVPVTGLKAKVDRKLKKGFQVALERQIRDQALPATVGQTMEKGKTLLYLQRMPPRKKPALELVEKLVGRLEFLRRRGDDAYLVTLDQLVQDVGLEGESGLIQEAIAEKAFRGRVVLALANNLAAPVALIEDLDRLAASALLLEFVLASARKRDSQAFQVSELKKLVVKNLQQPFQEALSRQLDTGTFSAPVGALVIKNKPYLFLLADVNRGTLAAAAPTKAVPPPPPSEPLPPDFASGFAEAFDRLDRAEGPHNFVSLVGLRQALPYDRATFDAGLHQLRMTGQYSLSAAEGRHGISPEEHEAGIQEDGTLLLFVSRKIP